MAINYTKLSTYDYHLPENLIAQTPLEKRDESRLLVFNRKTKDTYHRTFKDIKSFLRKGDVLVVNNTRVMPARLMAKKDTGAEIEVFLLKRKNLTDFQVLMKPAKRVKIGMILTISEELKCELLEVLDNGNRVVRFIHKGLLEDILDKYYVNCTDVMEENEEDGKHIFIFEVEGDSLESIKEIAGFVGKRAFNYKEGNYIKLGIE